jgi:hexosaminidase
LRYLHPSRRSSLDVKKNDWQFIMNYYHHLASVLSLKGELGVRLKRHYDDGDTVKLQHMVHTELPELIECLEQLRMAHMSQWTDTNKPFGWEVLDIRYGGLIARVKTAITRLEDFLDGRLKRIEELEEERLLFGLGRPWLDDLPWGRCNKYHRLVTASVISG